MRGELCLVEFIVSSEVDPEYEATLPNLPKEMQLGERTTIDVSNVSLYLYEKLKVLEPGLADGLIYMDIDDYGNVADYTISFYDSIGDLINSFNIQLVSEDGKSLIVTRKDVFEFFITKLVFSIANYLSYDISLIKRWQGTESILTN